MGKVSYADKLYDKFDFVQAIQVYKQIHKKHPKDLHINTRLANCYMLLRQPEKALPYYKEVVKHDNIDSKYYYAYAQALSGAGEHKKSEKWMRKFKESGAKDSRIDRYFENPEFLDLIFKKQKRYSIQNSKLNTKNSDYGAIQFNGDIYFVSARKDKKRNTTEKLYGWNNQPFLDIYKSEKNSNRIKKIEESINTKFHEGAVCFSPDGKFMYFTRNNYHEKKEIKDKQGTNHLKIFRAEWVDGQWVNTKPLFFSSDEYSIGHPSMSADGKKFFFTSDMPGGFGGTDIYMCEVHERGGLKRPVNLGKSVNTEGNEMYPFYHTLEDKLYFSSEGHPGIGQLDIFVADFVEGDFINVSNLGEPINSISDDFAFNLNALGSEGFVSSNRMGGKGDDDIYTFSRAREFHLKGIVTDRITKEPLDKTNIILSDSKGNILGNVITSEDGFYELKIKRNDNFQINADKKKFENKFKTFNSFDQEEYTEMIVNMELDPLKDMNILAGLDTDIIYFDFDKSIIREDAKVELDKIVWVMKKYNNMIVRLESHADSRGSYDYNIKLSDRRAKATYDYMIEQGIDPSRISSYKGYGEHQLANDCLDNVDCNETKHQANRRTVFVIERMD